MHREPEVMKVLSQILEGLRRVTEAVEDQDRSAC
jgi:hypothetical protein